ncbi:MAG: DUF5658 family protein [Candidatus Zipacnadales bacterium]
MNEVCAPERRCSATPTASQLQALWVPVILFVVISVADTVSSIYMLLRGLMEEYNPLMRWVWEAGGLPAFAGVKAFFILMPVWLFNRFKWDHYRFVYGAVWVTLVGYVVIYGTFFYVANY